MRSSSMRLGSSEVKLAPGPDPEEPERRGGSLLLRAPDGSGFRELASQGNDELLPELGDR